MEKRLSLILILSVLAFSLPSFVLGATIELTLNINNFQIPARSAMVKASDRPNTEYSAYSNVRIAAAKGNSLGTISAVNNDNNAEVHGVGTNFETFSKGDTITANGETRTISSIISNTGVITDKWSNNFSDMAYTGPVVRIVDISSSSTSNGKFQGNRENGGTISFTTGSNEVDGTDTSFVASQDYHDNVGDYITANGEAHQISSVESDTELHTIDAWNSNATNVPYGGSLINIYLPYGMSEGSYYIYLEMLAQPQSEWYNACKADCTPAGKDWYYLEYTILNQNYAWESLGCPSPPCSGPNINPYDIAVNPTHVIDYGYQSDYWRSPAFCEVVVSSNGIQIIQ